MTEAESGHQQPVLRDPERFKRLYPEGRAAIPPDARGEVTWKPTCVLIRERQDALAAAERARTGA